MKEISEEKETSAYDTLLKEFGVGQEEKESDEVPDPE